MTSHVHVLRKLLEDVFHSNEEANKKKDGVGFRKCDPTQLKENRDSLNESEEGCGRQLDKRTRGMEGSPSRSEST